MERRSNNKQRRVFRARTLILVLLVWIMLPLAVIDVIITSQFAGIRNVKDVEDDLKLIGRHLLEKPPPLNCTPRSIDEFPDDFMTKEQRQNGGIVFHVTLTLYLFAATAIACDDFFVPSMKKITQACNIPSDVAGATFMAAGSSAPEFFAAVVGIFFAKSDIGISTIVGSAIFNLLGVIAVCGLFAGMVVYLTWWTVTRDCLFYAVSVSALIIIIYDGQIHWYESLSLIALYVLYVVLVYFNKTIVDRLLKYRGKQYPDNEDHVTDDARAPLLREHVSLSEDMTSSGVHVSTERSGKYGAVDKNRREPDVLPVIPDLDDDEDEFSLTPPEGCGRRLLWAIMLPASSLMALTIPDFRRGGCWEKLYPMTFIVSITWIGGLCYVMVWMVTIIGDTFHIPDSVMGLTLLAVGSSVPDVIGSFLVARQSYGDMAVSNTVGSNIFDILMCLGLPWLLQTTVIQPNSVIPIASVGLTYTSITLLGAIIVLLVAFVANRWRLTKLFGLACLLAYIAIVTVACLYELNIFGNFTLPPCPS